MKKTEFLPVTLEEARNLGWEELDIILVSGDAYVDHPSFGTAIIGRSLAADGFRVGVIPQPDWHSEKDFLVLGKPRLFFGVTAGNLDSMVNHYTAQRKIRSHDAYSPEGRAGLRPDRATLVYTQRLKQLFKGVPVILGGIEASLRRVPHYDFWSDKIRNSVLLDSKADLLIYGMAEKTVLQVARLYSAKKAHEVHSLPGTVTTVSTPPQGSVILPDAEKVSAPDVFLEMNSIFQRNYRRKVICQKSGLRYLKHNPLPEPLSEKELDSIYTLPFARKPHPVYQDHPIPAFEQIKNSITSHRGCLGGCHFCALNYHQGKYVQSRSKKSILQEISELKQQDYFSGVISDVGGPTANMYKMECREMDCERFSCLVPSICDRIDTSHHDYLDLLDDISRLKGINHVFVASGIRSDLAVKSKTFTEQLVKKYTGGRLKLAPEHKNARVLKLMNKHQFSAYIEHVEQFRSYCEKHKTKHSLTPYIIVGHPGSTLQNTIELALYLKENNLRLKQVQEFTPTPMTISSCMYYTGQDFYTGEKIYVPKGRQIRLQKALVQWFMPENRKYVIEALKSAGKNQYLSVFLEAEHDKQK